MPLTFVDGSTAELVFPKALDLNRMGLLLFTAGGLGTVDRVIDARYGDGSGFMHRGPLHTYEGMRGPVEVWEGPEDGFAGTHLVYRFGDWFVGVRTFQDELTPAERAAWAGNLDGRMTADGFLVLEGMPPLVLERAGGHAGPMILLQAEGGNQFIELFPGPCRQDPAESERTWTRTDGVVVAFSRIGSDWFASWCEDGTMHVQVNDATREYAETAAIGLRVRNVGLVNP